MEKIITLKEETFAERNFRDFREFWANSRKLFPRKILQRLFSLYTDKHYILIKLEEHKEKMNLHKIQNIRRLNVYRKQWSDQRKQITGSLIRESLLFPRNMLESSIRES